MTFQVGADGIDERTEHDYEATSEGKAECG